MTFDRRQYWENKILPWERARYLGIPSPASLTLRRRLRISEALVRELLPAAGTILELGCGSGLLAERLRGHFSRYVGMDFAENAVKEARGRNLPNAEFQHGDVASLELPSADLVIFLGLVDWLNDEELSRLFQALRGRRLLFSYTEPPSVFSPYHWYRAVYDRLKGAGVYRARCFREEEVRGWVGAPARFLPRRFGDPGRMVVVRPVEREGP